MPAPITNLAAARQELTSIKEGIQALEEFFYSVERILGGGQTASLNRLAGTGKTAAPTAGDVARPAKSPMPERLIDRVFEIVRQAGGPIKFRSIVEEYHKREWPIPETGILGKKIEGALYSLTVQKQKLKRDNVLGYSVAPARANPAPASPPQPSQSSAAES